MDSETKIVLSKIVMKAIIRAEDHEDVARSIMAHLEAASIMGALQIRSINEDLSWLTN